MEYDLNYYSLNVYECNGIVPRHGIFLISDTVTR